jgi:hypothetical protein
VRLGPSGCGRVPVCSSSFWGQTLQAHGCSAMRSLMPPSDAPTCQEDSTETPFLSSAQGLQFRAHPKGQRARPDQGTHWGVFCWLPPPGLVSWGPRAGVLCGGRDSCVGAGAGRGLPGNHHAHPGRLCTVGRMSPGSNIYALPLAKALLLLWMAEWGLFSPLPSQWSESPRPGDWGL